MIAHTNAVVAEAKAHLHLRSFKAAQIFRKVIVSFAQCFAKRHSICGCFGGGSGSVRAQHKCSFAHKRDAAKSHLRDSKVEDGLHEWLFGRFQQFTKLRWEKSAGNFHLLLPVLRADHSRRNGCSAFLARAVSEQRGKFVSFLIVPIPNPIQPSLAFGDAAISTGNRVTQDVAERHLKKSEFAEKGFEQDRGQRIFRDDAAPGDIARIFGRNFRQ